MQGDKSTLLKTEWDKIASALRSYRIWQFQKCWNPDTTIIQGCMMTPESGAQTNTNVIQKLFLYYRKNLPILFAFSRWSDWSIKWSMILRKGIYYVDEWVSVMTSWWIRNEWIPSLGRYQHHVTRKFMYIHKHY